MDRRYLISLILIWGQVFGLPHNPPNGLASILLSEPGYREKLNLTFTKVGMAGTLDDVDMDGFTYFNSSDSHNSTNIQLEEKIIDSDISASKLYRSVYIWCRGLYSRILEILQGFTPKGVYKYISDNGGTLFGSLVLLSILGMVLMFSYWSFKMPQLCLASFQVYIDTLPLWISLPISLLFSVICIMYTISKGDVYHFYKDLYTKGNLTAFQATSICTAQIAIRVLCSIAVAFIAIFPPIWVLVHLYDIFIAEKPISRFNKSMVIKKLKTWDFGYYLDWLFGISVASYIALSLALSKGLVQRDLIYDLNLVKQKNE